MEQTSGSTPAIGIARGPAACAFLLTFSPRVSVVKELKSVSVTASGKHAAFFAKAFVVCVIHLLTCRVAQWRSGAAAGDGEY